MTEELLPPRFLFHCAYPVRRLAKVPPAGALMLGLKPEFALPGFDDRQEFAELSVGWHPRGLGFALHLPPRRAPWKCDPRMVWQSDAWHLWIDTRNTQSIHRAGRFCHHFAFLPTGGGPHRDEPFVQHLQIARAREETPLAKPDLLRASVSEGRDGVLCELWLPAEALHGYDPAANPKLGFYYFVRDSAEGEQFLSVGHEFPFASDPSLWWTLDLT